MKKILFIFLFISFLRDAKSQLIVSSSLTPAQLVNNILLGPGVVAFNIQYTGSTVAIGYFNGSNSNIGLGSGVIITNGKATNAIGPNNSTSATGINNTAGNATLTQICGQPTNDAAILEFDFVPSSDTVRFKYVFASEEYYEGVCTPYNDVFAFLISGPGITGQKNIAIIPGTINEAVSISSVNGGVLGQSIYGPSTSYSYCNLSHTNLYTDNVSPPGATVQYDGFTKVFIAKSKVIPCQTYHIRMAIADGGNDNTWDSGVFLEAGSFNTHYLSVNNQPMYTGCTTNTAAVEGTGAAKIAFKRFDSIPYPRTLHYTISGSASSSDYTISSPVIYFAPGFDTSSLIVTPAFDTQTESIETVSITIIPDFIVCNGWTIPGGQVRISDPPSLSPDFVVIDSKGCEPFCTQFNNISSGTTTATWNFGDGSPMVQGVASTHCYLKHGIYNVRLSIEDKNGCQDSITKNGFVTVYKAPLADFFQKTENITISDNEGVFLNGSLYASSFSWSLDDDLVSHKNDLYIQFSDTGCSVLKLVAYNENFCSDTAIKKICVKDGFNFWIPDAFTPDGDGKNDVFTPLGTDWTESAYLFSIFDRWGSVIYQTNNIKQGWNGKSGSNNASDDVYVWQVHLTDTYNKVHDLTGRVMLAR